MPPRFTYWTIILDGGPTAFRAAEREELLPTLKQLQSRHPDAVLKWFARGRLWSSPEEMREHARLKRTGTLYRDRGPDWRPGGTHRDPRDRFKKKPREGGRPERPDRPERPARAERPGRPERLAPEGRETREPRGPAPGGWKGGPPRFDSRQRRPYRPTGGSRRGGGGGKGRP
jgi:hypothetical protein